MAHIYFIIIVTFQLTVKNIFLWEKDMAPVLFSYIARNLHLTDNMQTWVLPCLGSNLSSIHYHQCDVNSG